MLSKANASDIQHVSYDRNNYSGKKSTQTLFFVFPTQAATVYDQANQPNPSPTQ